MHLPADTPCIPAWIFVDGESIPDRVHVLMEGEQSALLVERPCRGQRAKRMRVPVRLIGQFEPGTRAYVPSDDVDEVTTCRLWWIARIGVEPLPEEG
jgi:hypothetical protein